MKRGTSVAWGNDSHDVPVLTISKKRGKLTLSEIQDTLLYEKGHQLCGRYAILLNCTEAAVGGNGLWGFEDDIGDAVASTGEILRCMSAMILQIGLAFPSLKTRSTISVWIGMSRF